MSAAVSPVSAHADTRHAARLPVRRTRHVAGIEALFDPQVNLVVWQRPELAGRDGGDGWPQQPGRLMRSLTARAATPAAVAETLSLVPGAALAADVAMLCELFATLTGATRLGLRLDITDRATCPRFHVDRVARQVTPRPTTGGSRSTRCRRNS